MVVLQGVEEPEGVVVLFARVEHDDLVLLRVVVVLIERKELVDAQIREHGAYAIEEHIGIAYAFLPLVNMFLDTGLDIFKELRTVGVAGQRLLHLLRRIGISFLLFKKILQHRGVPQEPLVIEELAELIEEVQREHVLIACRTLEVTLELLYLVAHLIFLGGRVLIDVIVVEQVVLSILESGAVQLLV